MSETRERELVERVARAMFDDGPYRAIRWETATELMKDDYRKPARVAIEALSASTQVDAMRDALEEAREAIIALLNGRPARYAELLAKLDAALGAIP